MASIIPGGEAVKAVILSDISAQSTIGDGGTFETLYRRLSAPAACRSALRHAEAWREFDVEVSSACNRGLEKAHVSIFGAPAVQPLSPELRRGLSRQGEEMSEAG